MAARAVSLKGIFFIFLGSSSNQDVTSAYITQTILICVSTHRQTRLHQSNKKLYSFG